MGWESEEEELDNATCIHYYSHFFFFFYSYYYYDYYDYFDLLWSYYHSYDYLPKAPFKGIKLLLHWFIQHPIHIHVYILLSVLIGHRYFRPVWKNNNIIYCGFIYMYLEKKKKPHYVVCIVCIYINTRKLIYTHIYNIHVV